MSHKLLIPLWFTLSACATAQRSVAYAPADEASWFKFPEDFPEPGAQHIPGTVAAAIQLAMDDFLPREAQLPRGASPMEACMAQRAAYDVIAFPGSEGVMFVSIALGPGACQMHGPLLDVGATYAVDVRQGRVLAIQR